MDAISDPRVRHVCWMKSSQVGATEVGTNAVGYYIHQDPSPLLVLQPSKDPMARAWSTDRLDPMLADSPALRSLVRPGNRREKGDTILHKEFPGGQIDIVGSNSPSGLASRPKRILFADEVDRYTESAGKEGDPLTLAERRTDTFWNRKIIVFSTPTVKGASTIEAIFEQSDQRHYEMPCPNCGQPLRFRFEMLRWESGKPETVHYVCEHNGCVIEERDKPRMLALGKWVATHPGRKRVGFFINALYSPWLRWTEIVEIWIAAQGRPERLRVFANTILAETFNEDGLGANVSALKARRAPFPAEAPAGVGLITAACDVQGDRVEIDVWGWGEGEESWHLLHEVVWGDPAQRNTWDRVALVLRRKFKHESGLELRISGAAIDSGGHHTDAVYSFVKRRLGLHLWAIKGMGGAGIAPVRPPAKKSRAKAPVWMLGSDALKDILFARLATEVAGPGYMNLATGAPDEWIDQFAGEVVKISQERGRSVKRYVKVEGKRNEAIDLYCYALAALMIYGATVRDSLGQRAQSLAERGAAARAAAETAQEKPAEPAEETEAKKKKPRRRPHRSKWVHGY